MFKDVEREAKRNAELCEGVRRVMRTLDYGEYVRLAARLWKEGAPLAEIAEQTDLEMSWILELANKRKWPKREWSANELALAGAEGRKQ